MIRVQLAVFTVSEKFIQSKLGIEQGKKADSIISNWKD